MKTTIDIVLFLMVPFVAFGQIENDPINLQVESDSITIMSLVREIDSLKSTNKTLLSGLEIASKTLNELVRDKKVSDTTKWEMIKRNINGSAELYEVLSADIINLKSRLTDGDYQDYIKSLSNIQKGPLGFSFQEVIINSATSIGLFDKQSKLDRFIKIARNVINSPIISSIPFVSNAVVASNSILDIAYSSSMNDKNADLEKLQLFESELNNYLSYYTTLDKANIQNQTSSGDRKVLLENLQLDLLAKLKEDAPRLNFMVPERKDSETIDDYFNRIFTLFNKNYTNKYLSNIENKYKKSEGEISYSELLQKELDIKNYNNNINILVELAKKYTLYFENFFEVADNYQKRIIEAVDLAKGNDIIEAKKENGVELTPIQVYNEIMNDLEDKKLERDNGIKSSINIQELNRKMVIEWIQII